MGGSTAMNVGDIVKVTSKRSPDLSVTGIVVKPEDDMLWATLKTMFDDKFIAYGDDYVVEVIKRVEPTAIGAIHTSDNGKQYIRFRDHEYGWIMVNGDTLTSYRWEGISV
jgi:hypothetical protein